MKSPECPECGGTLAPEVLGRSLVQCPHCRVLLTTQGKELTVRKVACPSCGAPVLANAAVCPKCRAVLSMDD